MLELLTDPNAWLSLATLTLLEVILGIDNVIFLAIVSERLPPEKRALARRIGLSLALIMRIALLASISFILSLQQPIIELFGTGYSWRDVVLAAGGLFLLYKGTQEIHNEVEHDHGSGKAALTASFGAVILQIAVLDLVFSLDSVITAVGMADHIEVMIIAVVLAIIVMMVAAEPVATYISRHPTVKMLGLSFLLLVGLALIADAAHFHIPREYLYFAIAFSIMVEVLNQFAARKRNSKHATSGGHEKIP
jgi:predicted tellurium resistance membrane protein TerC